MLFNRFSEMGSAHHGRIITRNSFGYILSTAVGHLYVLGTIPILTRSLSPNAFGYYIILHQVVTLMQTLGVTLFSQSLLRFYVDFEGEEQKKFIGSVYISLVILQVVLALLFYLGRYPLMHLFYADLGAPIDPYVLYTCIWAVLLPLRTLTITQMKVQERPVGVFVLNGVYGLFLFGFLLLFVVWRDLGLHGALWAFILAELIGQVLGGMYVRRDVIYAWSMEHLRRCLHFSIPLLGSSLFFMMFLNLDRMVLSRYVSLEEIGIYGVGVMVGSMTSLIVSSYVSSYSPRLMRVLKNDGDREASFVIRGASKENMMLVGFTVSLLCILNDPAVRLLGDSQAFSRASLVVAGIATGHLVRSIYLFAQNSMFYKDKTTHILGLNIILVVIGVLVLHVLARVGGIELASFYVAISYVVVMPLGYRLARRCLATPLPGAALIRTVLALGMILAIEAILNIQQFDWQDDAYWGGQALQVAVIIFAFGPDIVRYGRRTLSK